jgi:hypothetical protein
MSTEATHDGEVANDVLGDPKEPITVFRRPRALACALEAIMRIEYLTIAIPDFDTRYLIDR